MAKYIELEVALALIQPDELEDEKNRCHNCNC